MMPGLAPGDPAAGDVAGGEPGPPSGDCGHPGVEAVLSRLREVETLDFSEQVATYSEIHHSLERILRSIDAA